MASEVGGPEVPPQEHAITITVRRRARTGTNVNLTVDCRITAAELLRRTQALDPEISDGDRLRLQGRELTPELELQVLGVRSGHQLFVVQKRADAGQSSPQDEAAIHGIAQPPASATPEERKEDPKLEEEVKEPNSEIASLVLLTGCSDGKVKLWLAESGQCLHTYNGHCNAVRAAIFSSDGCCFLTGSVDHTAMLWELGGGGKAPPLKIYKGHSGSVLSVAFSANEGLVVTGSEDADARIWDKESCECLKIFHGHRLAVRSASLSTDGTRLLTGSDDTTIKLWDVDTTLHIWSKIGHEPALCSATYSADGTLKLTGTSNSSAKVWSGITGSCQRVLEGHGDVVVCGAFSDDGAFTATGSMDKDARLWRVDTGECLRTFTGHRNTVCLCLFAPPGLM